MTHARFIASAALLASIALPGCDGLHAPSPSEKGAGAMGTAAAKARAVSRRITHSPEAASKRLPVEGGEARELAEAMLAPAEAAKELRALAGEVNSSAATDAQRSEARVLATRMRRDALMLDLVELERVSQLQGAVARAIEERVAAIRSIEASGELRAAAPASARVRAARAAREAYEAMRSAERARADEAQRALEPLEANAAGKTRDADALSSEIDALRARAATSRPSQALPLMVDARQKLYEAQDLRVAASEADREAEPYRSTVRIVAAATKDTDEMAAFLDARVTEAEQAETGAKARAEAAARRVRELATEAIDLGKEHARLGTELYEPTLKSVADALAEGNLASRNPTDAAAVAVAKARFAAIQVDAIDQKLLIAGAVAAAAGGKEGPGADAMRADRDRLVGEVRAALVEARDSLSGVDATAAGPMLEAIAGIAAAVGVDVTKPAAPAAPEPAPAESAAEAPAGDPPAAAPVPEGSADPDK